MTKTAKIRVHFENDPGLDSIFDVSQERIRQALKRNKEAARCIDLSFGHGEPGFEKRVADADVLFAASSNRQNRTKFEMDSCARRRS